MLTAAAVALIIGAFSFASQYLVPSSSKDASLSLWRNVQGSLLITTIYFVAILSVLALVRVFRKLS